MCEVLICVKDEPPTSNPLWDHKRPKAGDVIVLREDGHTWGSFELGGHHWGEIREHITAHGADALALGTRYYIDADTNTPRPVFEFKPHGNHPFWRVIRFPNITVRQMSSLLSHEMDTENASPYLQFRGWHIDMKKLEALAI